MTSMVVHVAIAASFLLTQIHESYLTSKLAYHARLPLWPKREHVMGLVLNLKLFSEPAFH